MASIVQPSVERSKASTRACLESARAPDAFVGKADELAVGNAFDAAGLFVFVPTRLALTGRVEVILRQVVWSLLAALLWLSS